ncbi:hypothetical protein [Veillonella caviae]|uniref:hypothetical protein n=1 Tax=Veillonella caviae TaxID=248316 RepID=UPI0023A7F6DE|nr:hypothetical protein [Veillonella caviae]MCI5708956.1 hypothetical protein [Veillonella caviae]MCI6407667.1 hypothetical protein [Veillonella caviae]MDY5714967.1 hypothetical protein [Veillonella caviae]MDY6225801.1 hypothetical protein [Veillonella caviae]
MNLLNKLQRKIEEKAIRKEVERIDAIRSEFLRTVPTDLLKHIVLSDDESTQNKAYEELKASYEKYRDKNKVTIKEFEDFI